MVITALFQQTASNVCAEMTKKNEKTVKQKKINLVINQSINTTRGTHGH